MEALEKAMHEYEITHKDVAMKLLENYLNGNAYHWFRSLKDNSITRYDDFVKKFKEEWDLKYDDKYLLHQLFHA